MRPAGTVRAALLAAARHAPGSLQELAERACVGRDAALHTVKNMTRDGDLTITGTRRVEYRNRPVAVYAAAAVESPGERANLHAVFHAWAG